MTTQHSISAELHRPNLSYIAEMMGPNATREQAARLVEILDDEGLARRCGDGWDIEEIDDDTWGEYVDQTFVELVDEALPERDATVRRLRSVVLAAAADACALISDGHDIPDDDDWQDLDDDNPWVNWRCDHTVSLCYADADELELQDGVLAICTVDPVYLARYGVTEDPNWIIVRCPMGTTDISVEIEGNEATR